jgi:O-antigen/teichoic acid export membrane protein
LRAYVASLFAFLLLRLDLLLVQAYRPEAEVGYFSVAASMADLLYVFPAVVGAVVFPRLASLESVEDKVSLASRISSVIAVACGVLAFAAWVWGRDAISLLYGPAFAPAAPAFAILAVAMWFYGINGVLSGLLASIGFPSFAIWIWALGVAVNVLGNLLLIPRFGIEGAAFASAIGYGLVLVGQLLYVRLRLVGGHAS